METHEPARLALIALAGVPEVQAGDSLASHVLHALSVSGEALHDGDAVVLAQKIVSKAEGRQVPLDTVVPSPRAVELARTVGKDARLVELILRESSAIVRARGELLIVRHRLGLVLANAGIDQSNITHGNAGSALLLPVDPDASCAALRAELHARTGVDVAVLIIDSLGRAWRNGTTGTAIGMAGMAGLVDLRGQPDRHGRTLQTSELGLADEVAAAASLIMGQAAEGRPIVLVRGIPYARREGNAAELVRPPERDLFP